LVNGKVYDLSTFYKKHPGGPDTIMEYAGKDGTDRFEEAGHTKANRIEMEAYLVGEYQPPRIFTKLEEIAEHNQPNDLWLLINNKVYDVSKFKHPGKFNKHLLFISKETFNFPSMSLMIPI
jgi:cytochrome b involved in lipid metabolism